MPATGSERRSSAVAGGMDTSRRLSASSDCSLPDRDRQCFQEHVETIPTRLPKLTSSKPAANPLQFIKVGPCDLYRSAQEQIRKVEEVKKIKEKRDEAEDWQSNLDNWKNSRRKRQEHIIERVVEVKKFELEEYDRNRKRSKTFNEMMEERTNRGRKVSLVVYKDDDDKDLSDLGLGANSGSRNNDSDDSEIQSMPGKEYAAESQRATIQTNNANDGQDTSLTSQESQEFTYEQAIQGYVNFAETRVKSKNSSRNEHHSVKEANCSLRSEERLNDDGKKEKTPPPVAPKPRKYSLKSEVPMTDKKSLGAEGNGCISDSTRKLSLPQVDVLKRREVFEKSSTSKDHSSKNKPAELIDTKTVKERLSSLGINSSGLSSRKKSSETEIKTSRQLQLQNPRKQPSESYINVNDDGKLEQNGDNNFGEKCYRSDSELLEESGSGLNSYDMNGNNSDNSLKERSLNSATDASTNNKFEIIADTHSKNEGYYRYEGDISDNRRTLDDTEQCWIQSDNTKHSRRKFHRSLDSLDKKYCDDVGSELLERVQSFEGLEHCNSVKDYPLSASSIEMLGSSSNGGDTDREDSGIHTADVSCSISQTDEAAEYGDPSAEISSTFSHLLLDKTAGNSDDHDVKCVAEEQAFSHFAASGAQEPNGTADTSRISLETCTSCEREEVLVSHVSTDEEMRDPACGYAEGQKDDASHENQKFLTSGLQRNDKVAETMLNDRVCVASFNELSNVVYEDHPTQKQPDLQEEPVKSFLTTEIVTKDLKNLRLSESPEKKSESFASTTAKMIESPITDTSQIIHQIPPLNLSSEIEIVAGLTFPLGPVTAAEPPKEKPPPPPPPQSDSDDEHVQRGRGLQRIDSTKRIKKEIRRKRTNFLGIEGNADDSYLEPELKVAPPPDMTTFLMEEQRLQKQLYRQSICSESDSNLGETTDSRDSGVELEKGNPDDIWVPKPSSTPDVLSLEHSRQNSEIYGTASIASEDDEIAKKEREIIETLEKEEQWQHGHSPHNHEENIGEELTEKLWQLEQDNLRLEWEKEAQRRELEETVQRREEEMRQKEREFQRHEAMLHMERTRLEREAEIIPRHKDKLPQPQQWGNKGRLSLQDISAVRHMPQKNITQFTPRSMLPEHCQSMPDLQQKRPEQEWKQQNPPKVVSTHHSQPAQQDWQEKENYSRSSWTPVFSPVTQQKDFQSSGTNHIQGQQMTRQTLQALSAVPRPRLIPTDNWIQAKRKPESKRGTFNSQHWLIQEAEQRRITEQQQRNAMASQKMPSQLSQPLLWMHQQPQQKKPLPDSVINTLTQRVQNKVDSKKYPNRTRAQDSQSREQIAGHHNILRPNGNPVTMNSDQTTEKMLSVSGKKKCSHCGEELGRGAAMIIESLRLFYHIDCFKCCVCHIQLGDGLMGTDVRVRNNKLHCHNCYSSEDGVKFSCV
ncbi:uncharacterized protein LOC124721418 isoform X3 [Schistocerca piceifrons]|uniref:uncharacterized protein LOC124721418 isoform X3 n=1 Tax=Schistocerca piceifrons TaxID=274613 RepID=UPI001F5E90CC|nr:uncharacterized protein LOC124721418 isoform X3 [Schistocerca piceifrons]